MKINISEIVKANGAIMDVKFSESAANFDLKFRDVVINNDIKFIGTFQNVDKIIKLKGDLQTSYIVKCSRCLKEVNGNIFVNVEENFINKLEKDDIDSYEYKGDFIDMDKVLMDSIILNLPIRDICEEKCKGFCPKCGVNLNESECSCQEIPLNPKFEALRNYFKT